MFDPPVCGYDGNYSGIAKSGLDITMGAVGVFGGPTGVFASAAYFIGNEIGWKNIATAIETAIETANEFSEENEKIIGRGIWNGPRM